MMFAKNVLETENNDALALSDRGKVLPYSIVCDTPRAVATVLKGDELRALLRLDAALRQRFLHYAAVGLARRVRVASTESLQKTNAELENSK